jgi:hypothetical protein
MFVDEDMDGHADRLRYTKFIGENTQKIIDDDNLDGKADRIGLIEFKNGYLFSKWDMNVDGKIDNYDVAKLD